MADVTLLSVLAALAVLSGSALQSATGFGFGILATPLLFVATSPAQAVGLMMLLSLEHNALTLATERRRPAPPRGETVRLLPGVDEPQLLGMEVQLAQQRLGGLALVDVPGQGNETDRVG